MQVRTYYVPWETGFKSLPVDLDETTPLPDEAVDALVEEQSKLIRDRSALEEELRLVTHRLALSGEAKIKALRENKES